MITFITSVIEQFGGRPAGSEAERNAQNYFKSLIESFCDSVEWHEFKSALNAKFHALKGFCLIYLLALVLYFNNIYFATAIAFVNSILFVGHFLVYGNWLDFLYKKRTSMNVIGNIEPQGEVKSTMIVSGHMDSVYEFQWWHKLGKLGALLTGVSGILIVTQPLFFLMAAIAHLYFEHYFMVFKVIWIIQLAMSPILITFYAMHGKYKVDGAIDNLTGVALALEMGKVFTGDKRLKHTRLKIISFGSEETGLRGSRHYVKDHLEELKHNKTVVLNTDTIKNLEELTVLSHEINSRVKYDEDLLQRMEQAFKNHQVTYKKIKLPIGATDGAAFEEKGIPTTSIIGMSASEFEPTYHTRLDKIDQLDPNGINALRGIMISFIQKWDEDLSSNEN